MSDCESDSGKVTQDDPKDPDYFPDNLGFASDDMSSVSGPEDGVEGQQQPTSVTGAGGVAPALRTIDLTDATTDVSSIIENAQNPNTRRNIESVVKTYNTVMESLRVQTGENIYTQLQATPILQLPHNLCRYVAVVVKQDGSQYNATTLEQHVARLQTWVLRVHKVDINTDPSFSDIRPILKKRCRESVEAGQRPGVNASRAVPEDLTKQAIAEGKFSRENPRSLSRSVVYIMQTGFGLRAIKVLLTNGLSN